MIERQLSQDKYLAGRQISLADIALLATIDPAEAAGIDLGGYQHLVAWRQALKRKDFYTKCHASYEAALKSMMAGAK